MISTTNPIIYLIEKVEMNDLDRPDIEPYFKSNYLMDYLTLKL